MFFEDLTPELQEKARACKSREELAELAKAVGVELSDDELEAVAGGVFADTCRKDTPCPNRSVPRPCPDKDYCWILNCTELADHPAECTELIDGDDLFQCGVLGSCSTLVGGQ